MPILLKIKRADVEIGIIEAFTVIEVWALK